MTRLIDADSIPWDVEGVGEIPVITKEEIDQLPTVNIPIPVGESVGELPVRHGKWNMKKDPFGFFGDIPVCSECDCTSMMKIKTKYCPHCGARMDNREERRMSYYQTMYGTDDVNTQFTDKDAYFGELVLRAIRDVECPMLITKGERDVVKKTLIKALAEWAERKEE